MTRKTSKKYSKKIMKRSRGSKSKTSKKRASKIPSLNMIKDINKVLKCDNQHFGCNVKPFKRFHCYKRAKTNKHTTKPDTIYLTNRREKGSRKLSKGVLKADNWFDCSHFKK
jgi:ribosome-binding ATPase YchF (GTP1/OBG family)